MSKRSKKKRFGAKLSNRQEKAEKEMRRKVVRDATAKPRFSDERHYGNVRTHKQIQLQKASDPGNNPVLQGEIFQHWLMGQKQKIIAKKGLDYYLFKYKSTSDFLRSHGLRLINGMAFTPPSYFSNLHTRFRIATKRQCGLCESGQGHKIFMIGDGFESRDVLGLETGGWCLFCDDCSDVVKEHRHDVYAIRRHFKGNRGRITDGTKITTERDAIMLVLSRHRNDHDRIFKFNANTAEYLYNEQGESPAISYINRSEAPKKLISYRR